MKRYYSHFTYIYPEIYMRNVIVEMDDRNNIVSYFPFEREIEKTEFYSGWILFMPFDKLNNEFISDLLKEKKISTDSYTIKYYNALVLSI